MHRKMLTPVVVVVLCLVLMTGCGNREAVKTSVEAETPVLDQALDSEEIPIDGPVSGWDGTHGMEPTDHDSNGDAEGVEPETMELAVDSPDGGRTAHQLPPQDDQDYRLELLRLPKWELNDLGDGKVEYRDRTYKRNAHIKAILGLGIDSHSPIDGEYIRKDRAVCDGIFLVALDTSKDTAKVLMIPRDTITEINVCDDDGNVLGERLDHIALGYSQESNATDGSQNMVKAVSELLCGLKINHYATINPNVLAEANDAVGGVTVMIPNDQLQKKNPAWTQGVTVTLKGDEAEDFLRYRDSSNPKADDTPIIRMSQHKEYMTGFLDALKSVSSRDTDVVEDLYDILKDNMNTDMSKGEILRLGADCVKGKFSSEDVLMLPGEEEDRDYTEYYADYEKLIPMILELFYREV